MSSRGFARAGLAAALAAVSLAASTSAASAQTCSGGKCVDHATFYRGPITFPAEGKSDPYPSRLLVYGIQGTISGLRVGINDFTHGAPADMDLLLVGPTGVRSLLVSDACGNVPVSGIDFALSSVPAQNQGLLPNAGCTGIGGIFTPTDYLGGADAFPDSGTSAPYSGNLLAFQGTDPWGDWQLFAFDDAPGSCTSGCGLTSWFLDVETVDEDEEAAAAAAQRGRSCGGRKPTLFVKLTGSSDEEEEEDGGVRSERTRGTSGADVIYGTNLNDVINGGGGNDLICGSDGNDRLIGGGGRDRLLGNAGKDRCSGGRQRDTASNCERKRGL